jgi:hypothetical protein
MSETELSTSRVTKSNINKNKIRVLEEWFKYDYIYRLTTIQRYNYLGLIPPETRYALELEAYDKENQLRSLKGLEPLPTIKYNSFI